MRLNFQAGVLYKAALLLITASVSVEAYKRRIITHLDMVQWEQHSPSKNATFAVTAAVAVAAVDGVAAAAIAATPIVAGASATPIGAGAPAAPIAAGAPDAPIGATTAPVNTLLPVDCVSRALIKCRQAVESVTAAAVDEWGTCINKSLSVCSISATNALQHLICRHPDKSEMTKPDDTPSESTEEAFCLFKAKRLCFNYMFTGFYGITANGEDGKSMSESERKEKNFNLCGVCLRHVLSACRITPLQALQVIQM